MLGLASSISIGAYAQSRYPDRPIKIIVPFSAGGSADVAARYLAIRLSESMGQPVVVDNRAGAAGIIGVDAVAKAPADGYTILFTSSGSLLTTKFLYKTLPFDVERDLMPIYQFAILPAVVYVNSDLPVRTVPELLQYVSKHPGKVAYGSWGIGSYPHLAGEYMSQSQRADMIHIAYKGESVMLNEVLGNRVQVAFGSIGPTIQQAESGRVRILGVTSEKRVPPLPRVATIAEQGVTDAPYQMNAWQGIAVPRATPRPVVDRIVAEVRKALQQPEMREKLESLGMFTVPDSSPESFGMAIKRDSVIWERLIRQARVEPQ